MNGGHPSFYALDRARFGLSAPQALQRHVRGCARCAAYVAGAGHHADVPDWARAGAAGLGDRSARRPWGGRLALGLGLLLPLAAAGGALWLRPGAAPPVEPDGLAVTAKGSPAVRVHVKRGLDVFTWDGAAPVRPGDRLQLELKGGDGHAHYSVAALVEGGPPVVLSAGPLGTAALLLPVSFGVDEAGGEEVLSVILADRPIGASAHRAAEVPQAEAGRWRQILVLRKEQRAPRHTGVHATPDGRPDDLRTTKGER
jgi:hypothetical protein